MKWLKVSILFVISAYMNVAFATNFSNQGWVKNGNGDYSTLSQRIYEWDQFPNGCYCFHGAGATAVNIRMGGQFTDTKKVHSYFRDKLKAYNNKTECATSSQDWLNASNKYHLKDLKIVKKPSSGHFNSRDDLWKEIKANVGNNKPMLVPITHYKPIYSEGTGFTQALKYEKLIGHAIIIVGYLDFGTKYVAIRDPALKNSNKSSHKTYFDYTLSLETLDGYLQSRQMLVFGTKSDANLKTMGKSGGANQKKTLINQSSNVALNKSKFYRLNITKNGKITTKLTNLSADLDLYIREGNSPHRTLAKSEKWGKRSETIKNFSVKKGRSYYIQVKGYEAGSYSVKTYVE